MDFLNILARAGGGGSGGGGAGGIIMLPIVLFLIITAWWARRKQIKKTKLLYDEAVARDPQWDNVIQSAADIFYKFQQDWSDGNVTAMKQYLTPNYYEHMRLIFQALSQLDRQNKMSDVGLKSSILFNIDDKQRNTEDSFDIEFTASAVDQLVDTRTNSVIFTSPPNFTEVWHFDRSGKRWLLESIAQVDAEVLIEKGLTSQTVKGDSDSPAVRMLQFANNNNFYFNYDFGWLLLPLRGMLFGAASFGRSDINYHIIGEHKDRLVQFYEYVPLRKDKHTLFGDIRRQLYKSANITDRCTVAQAVLPKTYTNISIRRNYGPKALARTPRGLNRIQLEGIDFEKNFAVYSTDTDKVTSFELLNPSFMQQLLDAPYEINVEVVDNLLYLYSFDVYIEYESMMILLDYAFNEMKL